MNESKLLQILRLRRGILNVVIAEVQQMTAAQQAEFEVVNPDFASADRDVIVLQGMVDALLQRECHQHPMLIDVVDHSFEPPATAPEVIGIDWGSERDMCTPVCVGGGMQGLKSSLMLEKIDVARTQHFELAFGFSKILHLSATEFRDLVQGDIRAWVENGPRWSGEGDQPSHTGLQG